MENHSFSPNARHRHNRVVATASAMMPAASASPLSPRYASRLRSRSNGSTGSTGSNASRRRRRCTAPTPAAATASGTGSAKALEASPQRRKSPGGYSSRHIPSRAHLPSFNKKFETSFSSPIATCAEPSADFSPSNSPLTLLCSRSRRSSSKSSPFKRQRSPPTLTPAGLGGAAAMPHLSLSAPPASSASADFTPMSPSASASPSRTPPMRARRALSFGHDPVSSLPPLSLPPLLSSSSSLPPPDRRGGNGGQFGILGSAPKSDISSIGGGGGGSPLGALEFDAHHGARRGASHAAGGAFRRLNFSSGPRTRDSSTLGSMGVFSPDSPYNPFARSPIDDVSFRMPVQQRRPRHIASQPYKILDAPNLKDDFYLNLVDWSSSNLLAVGLDSCLYLWSACNSKVTKLCDVARPSTSSPNTREQRRRRRRDSAERDNSGDYITSVAWAEKGPYLAIGTEQGQVQLWDVSHSGGKGKLLREFEGHDSRVGALAWNGRSLVSGSRDRHILMHDTRQSASVNAKFLAHKQEVCGLKWSSDDERVLASGGNDNKLMLWDARKGQNPFQRFSEHTAAVKAIAWSPHTPGLLASGGGTADRCIRFWDTLSAQENSQKCVDTGSQVCNLAWSKNVDEIVSTHGYSLNQIVIWNAPSMTKVKTLTGHSYRVLYLAASPDGQTVVTGAGDETLRFWSVFPESPHRRASHNRRSIPFTISRSCELR